MMIRSRFIEGLIMAGQIHAFPANKYIHFISFVLFFYFKVNG